MNIYSINKKGDWKLKREINENDYKYSDCGGSLGIEIKHKKNGKTLFLATKEMFDSFKKDYENTVKSIGICHTHIVDENGVKLRDKRGNPIRKYVSQKDADECMNSAISYNYIHHNDFLILYNFEE